MNTIMYLQSVYKVAAVNKITCFSLRILTTKHFVSTNKLCILLLLHITEVKGQVNYLGLLIQNDIMGGVKETLVNELHVTPLYIKPLPLVTTTTV